jgi:gliding motility-associated-like protein
LKNTFPAGVIILLAILTSPDICWAEGTKQLKPDSTYVVDLWIQDGGGYSCFATEACGPGQKLFIHIAHPGEKIYIGFRSDTFAVRFKIKLNNFTQMTKTVIMADGTPGYIKYYSQAVAGPMVLDPHGYIPVTFVPQVAGDYSIDFITSVPGDIIPIQLFDITVIDTTVTPLVPINGRLWSKDWGFNTYNFSLTTHAMLATQYILTDDSIVTSLNYNHMQGWNFDITSTKNGCYPPPYPWDSSCMSRPGNHHYAQYKIFVNDPDSSEYPTGSLGVILGDTVSVYRSCTGYFTFTFVVNKPGTVKLNIEPNLAPGIQPEDVTLNRTVVQGVNTVLWNGIDGLGNPVPCGDSVAITMNYINGLTNIALYDVERNLKGFIIELVRPPGLPIATYWNDTLLASDGGQTQLGGCYANPPDTGCHTWTGGVGYGLGSMNTVNTWWYATTSVLDLGRFKVDCVPHTPQDISGPIFVCSNEDPVYTVVPDPLPGSEPQGYEWELTDAASGAVLMDSVDAGSVITIDFSNYLPGQKRLKVRGRSDLCGYGAYGPGILITVTPAPEITNTQLYISVCSGDTTDILLQSSMAGTTFSYTVAATSPFITGQSPGTQNPISQILFNSGTSLDSVLYYVVPFVSPCPGDTAVFVVVVNPTDTLVVPLSATANPACEGMPVTCFVPALIGGPSTSFAWLLNGYGAGTNSNEFTFIPSDSDRVQCILYSPLFCTPGGLAITDELVIGVIPAVTVAVTVTPSANPVCEGDSVIITATSVNGGTSPAWQWQVNGIGTGTSDSVYTYFPVNGDEVICIITSNHFCVTDSVVMDTVVIQSIGELKVVDTILCYGTAYFAEGGWQTTDGTYYDTLVPPVSCIRYIETTLQYKPEIPVDLGEDTTICGDILTLNAWVNGGTYLWQDGSSGSEYIVTGPGVYSVEVVKDQCSVSDTVKVDECPVKLWFPDAFTPNGDGLNDTFHPKGLGVEKFSMQIYNRWGGMVYETNALEPGWDGTYKGTLCPEGTYVYIATFEGGTGKTVQAKGTVVLQR